MDKPSADPLVGTTVAQYAIEAKLGGGGMGVVYAARDTKLGRRVALKFLPPQWSHDESAKERFLREAQAASATDHRNICTIHDIGVGDQGQVFIVMAYYEGQTLKQRLDAGPVPMDEAIEIAAQVAEGLAKAHAQGVVHRDIKPGNLILTEDSVKILDFGLAKFADARFKLTLEGSTLGTVAYMSPEQARGEDADARTDIWATGAVLYEMLSGTIPFKGAYPEAISHAIKNTPPPPLRAPGRNVSEALEQLVFRALHKDPRIRFQTARDLARALRQIQGRTVPVDLRTEPVPVAGSEPLAAALPPSRPRPRWWATRAGRVAAVVAIALTVGMPVWVFTPVDRVPVAVAPVVNQTGYAELDDYRLALTQELVAQLGHSSRIRVLPYDRLLETIRAYRQSGDISSREALRAIATQTGARMLVVPSVVYENDAWIARAELRDPETAISDAVLDTTPVVSSLMKDAVYGLMAPLAAGIDQHFTATGPRRAAVAASLFELLGRPAPPRTPTLRTLDAAVAFERGLDAYEQVEYAAARREFARASELDPRHPLPLAWRSRAAGLMRQDKEAAEAADQAAALPADQLPARTRQFVEAVVTEARRDWINADARYRALAERYPDEPAWLIELAGFHDRQGRTDDALAAYHAALALDSRSVRPHVDLCRLYSPSRLNEPALARERGETALAAYRALNNRAGEAQALWCLADVLRAGSETDRRDARQHADTALQIMQALEYPYGLARAFHYVGVVALLAERDGPEAAAYFEKALAGARDTGNVFLESRTLMNLGVSHELFGQRSAAVNYYRESFELSEAMGNEQEAAWSQINAAAILIDYGGDQGQALRDAQNALVVFQQLGDRYFEVFARRMIASYHRHAGRRDEALRELTIARSIAMERNLDDRVAQVSLDLARLRFDAGDYLGAQELLLEALDLASGTDHVHARIELGRTYARMGRFEEAATALDQASTHVETTGDIGSRPLLSLALGELAYESGRLDSAAGHLGEASALWTDDLPEAPSVEARAYLGLLESLQGDPARGRTRVVASLEQAGRMHRVALDARCRLMLARIEMAAGRPGEAMRALMDVTPQTEATLGAELRAQFHHWRGQVLAALGDPAEAAAEAARARQALDELRRALPDPYWRGVLARTDLRAISGT